MSDQTPVTKVERNITDQVLSRVASFQAAGEMRLPKDYSPENALKSAYLILSEAKDKDGKQVLQSCSQESIAQALLKMVTEGLSPMKRQGSFIAYGGRLSWQREYAGNIAMARRVGGLKKIKANAIFEGDVFEFEVDTETGRRRLIKHTQTLKTVGSGKIIGAYAITELEDGTKDMEVMDIVKIQKAWEQSINKGKSPAHINFPDQMAAKTVINRACKLLINTSDDSDLYDDDQTEDVHAADVKSTISERANKQVMTFEGEAEAEVIANSAEEGVEAVHVNEANPI